MDNGLIFPYPCVGVPDESILLTTQKVVYQTLSRGWGSLAAWDPGW
jgi:hypothetical protein